MHDINITYDINNLQGIALTFIGLYNAFSFELSQFGTKPGTWMHNK